MRACTNLNMLTLMTTYNAAWYLINNQIHPFQDSMKSSDSGGELESCRSSDSGLERELAEKEREIM